MLQLTIAGCISFVEGKLQCLFDDPVVGAVHEAEVCATVEHVEVDAGVVIEDVGKDFRKL